MKNILKLLLAAMFLIGPAPANTITQEVVKQECKTTSQCCQIVSAEDGKKKKKKKGKKKIEKGKKKKKGFFSKVFGSK